MCWVTSTRSHNTIIWSCTQSTQKLNHHFEKKCGVQSVRFSKCQMLIWWRLFSVVKAAHSSPVTWWESGTINSNNQLLAEAKFTSNPQKTREHPAGNTKPEIIYKTTKDAGRRGGTVRLKDGERRETGEKLNHLSACQRRRKVGQGGGAQRERLLKSSIQLYKLFHQPLASSPFFSFSRPPSPPSPPRCQQ